MKQPKALLEDGSSLDVDLAVELAPQQFVDGMKVDCARLTAERPIGSERAEEPPVALLT